MKHKKDLLKQIKDSNKIDKNSNNNYSKKTNKFKFYKRSCKSHRLR